MTQHHLEVKKFAQGHHTHAGVKIWSQGRSFVVYDDSVGQYWTALGFAPNKSSAFKFPFGKDLDPLAPRLYCILHKQRRMDGGSVGQTNTFLP